MSEDPLVGGLLAGKFLIKRCIGRGGMGAVYEAENISFGKRVAIKIIGPECAASKEMAARFRNEARAASKIESEHIAQVFDVGEDPERGLYMVMELLSGEDLAVRLEREKRLAPEIVVAIGVQTARTLAQAHEAGVVHRDLKPANLFLTTRSNSALHVKILDFGISKLHRAEGGGAGSTLRAVTKLGTLLGTPQYMSPQQAQGLPVDARSDVWSLGAVLYEALAGRPAFADTTTYEQMIIQIVTKKPEPLAAVAPWVPAALAEVVHAALTPDLEARLPSAARLAEALTAASAPEPVDRRSVPAPVPAITAAPWSEPPIVTGAAKPTIGATVVDARPRSGATKPVVIALAAVIGLAGSAGIAKVLGAKGPGASSTASSGVVVTPPPPPTVEVEPRATATEPIITPAPLPPEPAASASSKPAVTGRSRLSPPPPVPPRTPATAGGSHVKDYE